jgi:hypothetical protein
VNDAGIPLLDLLLGRLTGDSVFFLYLPDQLIVFSVDDVEVIVGQFSPALLYRSF